MYVITGATGHTGSTIADKLLDAGKKVRVVGRDAKRLERFRAKGAEVFVADVADADAIARAFSDARAAYVMIPPNPASADVRDDQERVSDAVSSAIDKNRVPYAVLLSSMGADKSEGTGPVVGLHNFEKKLGAISGLNAVYLRAGYFMENLLAQLGVIQSFGIVAGPVRADLLLPMTATHDIGNAAADFLSDLNFSGKAPREVLGARDISYNDMASIIGAAIGRAGLSYMQMPAAQLKPALVSMGMSANMADLLLEMADALNSGHMKALEPRSAANTTPTTFESFVATQFAPAFKAQAAGA